MVCRHWAAIDWILRPNPIMLTNEAYANRLWGDLPALRKLLEHRFVPDKRDNPMLSTSDSEVQQLERVVGIALTVLSNAEGITNVPSKEESILVREDLHRVQGMLRHASETFQKWAEGIYAIERDLAIRIDKEERRNRGIT